MDRNTHSPSSERALLQQFTRPTGTGGSSDIFSIVDHWRILQKRKWSIALCVLIMGALALVISLHMTPKYEAVARIEVNKENSDMLGLDSLEGMAGGGSDSLDYNVTLQTQADVLQSDSLLFQVSEQLGLEKRKEFALKPGWFDGKRVAAELKLPLEKAPLRREKIHSVFDSNLTVKPVRGTRIIEVKFMSPEPQVAADVANTLVNDYLEQYFRTRYAATAQASDWLGKQLSDLKTEVEESQTRVTKLQKEAGILGVMLPSSESSSSGGAKGAGGGGGSTGLSTWPAMDKLQDLNKALTAAESDRILKETVYHLAKSGDPELISSIAGSSLIGGGGGALSPNSLALVQTLRAQEAQLKVQYAQEATKYGAHYPLLEQSRNQMKDLDESIQVELRKVASRAENDYLASKHNEDMVRAEFEAQKAELGKLQDVATQYTIAMQEASGGRTLYTDLLTKLKEGGVLAGLHSTNIVVVDPGRTAPSPKRPSYPLNLALGLGIGLVGGIGLAFMQEGLDNTVHTPEQVESVAGLPSFGIVPEAISEHPGRRRLSRSKVADGDFNIGKDPHSQMAEAFRALRTSILLSNVDAPPKVIMVTSSLPQEGKTTTSVNVAISLSQQGSKVLLIDGDLRRPSLHTRLKLASLNNNVGLSGTLASTNGFRPDFLQVPEAPNLFVLPAGARPPYPAELLGSKRMRDFLDKWRKEFDFIVVDTPPVLSVTDPVVMSRNVDAVLLVVRSKKTTKLSLLRTRDILLRANALIAGVLVNRVDLSSPEHYYYYGYSAKYGDDYYHHHDDTSKN
jgi:capsular exopolysaccharide synthesis family protein